MTRIGNNTPIPLLLRTFDTTANGAASTTPLSAPRVDRSTLSEPARARIADFISGRPTFDPQNQWQTQLARVPTKARDLGTLRTFGANGALELENLGPGNLSFPLVGGTPVGDQIAVVSRYIEPTQVALFDPATQRVTQSFELPNGSGAFAIEAMPDGSLVVGQYGAKGEENLYHLNPETGAVTATAVDANLLWDLDSGPSGDAFGVATQPPSVFRVDLESGTVFDYDVLAEGQNPRAVASTEDDLYVGGKGPDGRAFLSAVDLHTRPPQAVDVTPAAIADHDGIYTLEHSDRHLVAGTTGPGRSGPAVVVQNLDGTGEPVIAQLPEHEREVDAIAIDEDTGEAFATARPSGTLYRIDMETGEAQALATPVPQSETRSISVDGDRIQGVSSDGTMWNVDIDTGATDGVGIVEAGATPGAEAAQSIAVNGDHLYTAGSFNVGIRNTETGGRQDIALPGEAKDMAVVNGVTYFAVYPQGEIWSHRPGDAEARRVAALPPSENRPISLEVRGDDLFVSTASDDVGNGGLHRLDTETGELASAPPLLGDGQWLGGITSHNGVTYVGGSQTGLAAVDAETLEPLWEVDHLVEGAGPLIGLEERGGKLFGLTGRGHLLVIDPANGALLHHEQIAESGGRLVSAGDKLYGVNNNTLFEIDPSTYGVQPHDLGADAHNFNYADLYADGRDVYLVQGQDIARFEAPSNRTHFIRQ